MKFEELIETIKGKLYERISHPFLFSFTFFFFGVNWRFFYKLYIGDSITSIDLFLQTNPIQYCKPALYSLYYVLFIPLLSLFSEPYAELVKTGILKIRNYMRKNWQEHDMKTIAEIEEKYIQEIDGLRSAIGAERRNYFNISESLKKWFRKEHELADDVILQFYKCFPDLMVGDIALDQNGDALRGAANSGRPILGVVVDKPGSEYAFVIEKGVLKPSVLDIREKQNINKPGKYCLSDVNMSRLNIVPDREGTYQVIGELLDDGTFLVEKQSLIIPRKR
ncbi:hypothetical protein [Leptospira licerasiae]|uniref:hypothetical protein n=1 Tax=Leptospira licerasiae TaxID=447106 RepID=UPI001083FF65|nr:hypothetical protein [Leptospira licerasiae]TGM89002.1 hypothetical protein EHR05_12440 [Leptospira licerasiae]